MPDTFFSDKASSGRSGATTSGVMSGMAAGALWGLIFVIPLLVGDFNVWQLSSARYLIYGGVALGLLVPRWHRVTRRIGRREWSGLIGLSVLGNVVYYVLLALGVQWAGSAPTALIIGLIPIVITLMGSKEQGAVRIRSLLAPMALCVFGVLAVAAHSLGQAYEPNTDVSLKMRIAGLLCAAGALACWAAYSVWNRRWLLRFPELSSWDWMLVTGTATGAAALLLAIPAFLGPVLLSGSAPQVHHHAGDWLRFLMVVGAMAVLSSVVGNSFWNAASRLLPSTMIGQMIVFETLFALLYGFLYEQRLPSMPEWLAIGSLIAGIVWSAHAHHGRRV